MSNIGTTVALIKAMAPTADPEAIESAVANWLDDHPEATTTVQDGAVSYEKLDSDLKEVVDDVPSLKTEINSKQDAPETAGTAGQVLTLDSNLAPVWQTPSGGGGTVDDELSTSSTNPVQNKVITGEINFIEGGEKSVSHITPVFEFSVTNTTITSNTIQIKNGDTITFNRTAEANGKLYGTASLHKIIDGTDTYINFANPATFTADQDMEVYLGCFKTSTATITLDELCELATPCFGGSVTVVGTCALFEKIDGKQDKLTFDNAPTENSTNPVTSGGIFNTIGDVPGLKNLVESIADVENQKIDVDASKLEWSVIGTSGVSSEHIAIKSGSTLQFQRTAAATGNLYNPVSLYIEKNGVSTYSSFSTGDTHTFDSDCTMWIAGVKVSTSTKTIEEIAVLAKDCFSGTLKTEKEIDIVNAVKAIDGKIETAVAPALGGDVDIDPSWTDGYYYNSSLAPVSYSGMKIAKVDVSKYVNAEMTMLTYANSSAFCGFTDENDSIISAWHQQTTALSRVIPINAKWLYISNAPANLAPAVFSCVIKTQNAAIGVAYLDVATGLKKYDSTKTYRVGELCTFEGKLKHCIADTTGTYDPDDWQDTTIIEELGLRDYIHPITKLKGLSWKACGDSITAGSNGPSYVPLMASLLGITTYTNSGIGGAYLATCYNGAAVTDDIVTLFAGTNDFGLTSGAQTLSAFETSVRTVISNFKTNNQTARLYMITPIPRFDKTENENHDTLLDFVDVMEEVCAELNVPCLNLYERCGITAENYTTYLKATQGDLVHPNAYGAMRIAVEVANFVSEMEAIHRVVNFRS